MPKLVVGADRRPISARQHWLTRRNSPLRRRCPRDASACPRRPGSPPRHNSRRPRTDPVDQSRGSTSSVKRQASSDSRSNQHRGPQLGAGRSRLSLSPTVHSSLMPGRRSPDSSLRRHPTGGPVPKPTIVLVHGAWADGSSWNAVSIELQGQGFTVLTPPNLLHGVAGDAAYIASFLAQRTDRAGRARRPFLRRRRDHQRRRPAAATSRRSSTSTPSSPRSARASSTSSADRAPRSTFPTPPPCSTSPATPAHPRVTSRRSSSRPRCTTPSPRTSPRRTGG